MADLPEKKDMDSIDEVGAIATGWENAPTLEDLKNDYAAAKPSHDAQQGKIKGWLDNLNVKSGAQATPNTSSNPFSASNNLLKRPDGRSKIQSKLIKTNAEWRYTSLSEPFLNTPDIYNVEPTTAEDVNSAYQNGLVLNNQFNTKLKKVALIDSYIRSAVTTGVAIVKVGWDYRYKKVMKSYPTFNLVPVTTQAQLQELQQYSQSDPATLPIEWQEALAQSQALGAPHFPVESGTEQVEEEEATRNQPTVEICNSANVVVDPSCGDDADNAQFVIYSFESNLSDLEKKGNYKNLDQLREKSESTINDPNHTSSWSSSGFEFSDAARKKLVVHEYWGYWDINNTGETVSIVATWVGDVLIRMEENPYPDQEIPFIFVSFLPVADSIYGEPDGELLEDNQRVKGAIMRGMIDLMGKSANGQTGIRKGSLDYVNKRRFEQGLDYEFNEQGDGQNSIYQHKYPEIPASAYNLLGIQDKEAESMTGVKAFSDGISGAGLGSTAAAANGALSAAARRELGILRRLAEGVKVMGRKIIAMNQVFLSEEEVVRVTNEEFVTVRKDDLGGKFDLTLSISTAEADEQKAKELAFMLQTTGQTFGLEFTKLLLAEIADLRKMSVLAKAIRSFQAPQDPMAIKMKELELAVKQAEIGKIQAETQKILAEAAASGVKSQNIQSDTDKKNLDFVEQESGVHQQRELQKLNTQTKNNMELEAFKHTLNPKQVAQ